MQIEIAKPSLLCVSVTSSAQARTQTKITNRTTQTEKVMTQHTVRYLIPNLAILFAALLFARSFVRAFDDSLHICIKLSIWRGAAIAAFCDAAAGGGGREANASRRRGRASARDSLRALSRTLTRTTARQAKHTAYYVVFKYNLAHVSHLFQSHPV